MCDKENCNCGSNPCCGDCEPWNCVEQAVNDVWATKETQIEGLVDRAETAAENSEASAKASAESAAEAKEFRDEAETAATTAVAAEGVVLGVANTLQDTADKLKQIADELGSAIAGISVVTWYYTAESDNQTVIPVPVDKNQVDVQAIYIEGARQEPNRGFTYDALNKEIILAEGIPLGMEISIIIGTYSDNPNDFANTLASNNGASLVGTASGQTVQQEILNLREENKDTDTKLRGDLAATAGADLVGASNGKTVQDNLSALGVGYFLDSSEVSTAYMANKKAMVVYRPLTVVDSDNQGAKILDNTTIIGAIPNQNPIKATKKAQSALRLAGSNITLKQLRGEGSADNTNTSTAEFITSRMASLVDGITVKNLVVDDVFITGFTTGIALAGVDGATLTNIRGENLRFSPDGLNSAGGYLVVFGGGTSKNINISNVYHKLVAGADRHTLYISAMSTEKGWKNVVCENITCDWTANSINNKGTNGVPFAMNPIHVRTGDGLCINNFTVTGYCAGIVVLENQYGPITNVSMTNMVALECQSYQNGQITDTGSIDIGFGAYAPRNQYINISNCITKIIRGIDNSGAKMAAGSDIGVVGANADFITIVNNQFTMESGAAIRLVSCNDVVIDDIVDNLIDTTSGINSIILNNCSRVTLGNIRSNRAPTQTKERIYSITDSCTEITCRFPRRVVLLVTNNTVTVTEDRWDMLNGSPVLNADGKTINIPLKNHVSTNAKRTCNVHNTTMANVKAIRVGDIDSNTLRVGFWDTSLNAQATPTTANNLVVIEFTC